MVDDVGLKLARHFLPPRLENMNAHIWPKHSYDISQKLCTRYAFCRVSLWLDIWFTHIVRVISLAPGQSYQWSLSNPQLYGYIVYTNPQHTDDITTAKRTKNKPGEHFIGHHDDVQYIPRNMHAVFALLCFVVVIHWLIFPYPSGLLHWHCGNLTIAPVPAKQS